MLSVTKIGRELEKFRTDVVGIDASTTCSTAGASTAMGRTRAYSARCTAKTEREESHIHTPPATNRRFQGRAETARVLIADARVPNEQHSDGSWPIHRACWGTHLRHAETVRWDQLELRDAKGHTPMFLANQSGNKAIEFRRRAKQLISVPGVDGCS